MQLRAGTSGFSYKEWKGGFYPSGITEAGMLAYYAAQLPSVEINNTFYRMPRADMLAGWAGQVPADFRFALKASRRITHQQVLKNCLDPVTYLFKAASALGERLGPVLFQLPPFLKKDVARLGEFLAILPDGCRAAFEFRQRSWFDDEVYELLRARDAALVCGDGEDPAKSPPLVATASWGYLRLRAPDYSDGDLDRWAESIRAQPWQETYAFFKHETRGPELALGLGARFGAAPGPGLVKPAAPAPQALPGPAQARPRSPRKKKRAGES